jgi:hypothetical protein
MEVEAMPQICLVGAGSTPLVDRSIEAHGKFLPAYQ